MKAVFDNLIQLEHLNIVKFHKYWADVKENRARVRKTITTANVYTSFFFFIIRFCLFVLSSPSGYFHHRVHVFWEPKAVSKEDKEEP